MFLFEWNDRSRAVRTAFDTSYVTRMPAASSGNCPSSILMLGLGCSFRQHSQSAPLFTPAHHRCVACVVSFCPVLKVTAHLMILGESDNFFSANMSHWFAKVTFSSSRTCPGRVAESFARSHVLEV